MNYKKIYDDIINNRLKNDLSKDEYGEKHHILPRSLGGSNKKVNIVKLTAREHFICHILLSKMYKKGSNEYHKMINAVIIMKRNNTGNRYFNGRLYEIARIVFSKQQSINMSGKGNPHYGTMWIMNISLEENKKVPKEYILEEDWVKGRCYDFKKKQLELINKINTNNKPIYNTDKITYYTDVYLYYKCYGLKKTILKYNISTHRNSLINNFRKYSIGYKDKNILEYKSKEKSTKLLKLVTIYDQCINITEFNHLTNSNYTYTKELTGLFRRNNVAFNRRRKNIYNDILKKNAKVTDTFIMRDGWKYGINKEYTFY